MGSDQFHSLSEWREAKSLAGLAQVCVLPRRGHVGFSQAPPSNVSFDWTLAPFEEVDVSSSEIRKKVQQNLPYSHLVLESVREIIVGESLYQT